MTSIAKTVGFTLFFLAASAFVGANAHTPNVSTQTPNGHEHFHCHQNKTCHSHSHDVSHH